MRAIIDAMSARPDDAEAGAAPRERARAQVEPARRPGPLAGAELAAAATAGWVLHDLGVYLRGGELGPVLSELLPGSLAAVAAAGAAGALLAGRVRAQWILVGLLGLAAWRFESHLGQFRAAFHSLLRALLGLSLAFAVGAWSSERLRVARAPLGLALGFAACAAKTYLRFGASPSAPFAYWLCSALLLAAGLLSDPARRRRATALALGVGLAAVGWSLRSGAALERADLAPPATAGGARPNLLLVVLDTARADHFAPYGYERVTTPHLDAFAREHATRYANARSTSPFTLSSHGSLLTGLCAGEHGASVGGPVSRPLRSDATTLAERLRDVGYRTGAVVANRLYLNRRLGFDRGFEHFDSRRGTSVDRYLALASGLGRHLRLGRAYRDAERITDLALEWLAAPRAEPFFLFLNYLDAHDPLAPPDDLRGRFPGPPADDLAAQRLRLYDQELLGIDRQLARLFEHLRASGRFESTLIAVTSDHGEGFGQHGIDHHCWVLYEEQLRVPLYVKPAGGRRAALSAEPIGGAGVHDLLLRELGLEPGPRPERLPGLLGEWYSWPLTERELLLQERFQCDLSRDSVAWLRDGIKTIVFSDGTVERYDLERDPGELAPLPLSAEERERDLAEARDWWATHPLPSEAPEATQEELADLRALGYG